MSGLELLLEILKEANLATPIAVPTIVSIINTIRGGRAAGKSDDEIKAESMQIALETRSITETDMGNQP